MRGSQARSSLLIICPDVFVSIEVCWGVCVCVCARACARLHAVDLRHCSCWGGWESTVNLPHSMGIVGFAVSLLQSAGSARAPVHLQLELRDQHWVFLPQHPRPRSGHTEGDLMTEGRGPQCCLITKN